MPTDSIRESKGVWPPWCDMTSGTPEVIRVGTGSLERLGLSA